MMYAFPGRILVTSGLAAVLSASLGCGTSRTTATRLSSEDGTLVVILTQPCSTAGTASVVVDGNDIGQLKVSGSSSFSIPPGSHQLRFRRGNGWSARERLVVPPRETLTLNDPPGACTFVDPSY